MIQRGPIAGLLLAAGAARRFGSQKLLHPIEGEPLVRLAARRLLESGVDNVVVVVGCDADDVRAALHGLAAHIVEAADWRAGMSASIRAGVEALPAGTAAVVIALGDQPDIDASVIDALIARWNAADVAIVAAKFADIIMPPVLFGRALFPDLMALTGDSGARSLLDENSAEVAIVAFPGPVPQDIDLPGDVPVEDPTPGTKGRRTVSDT